MVAYNISILAEGLHFSALVTRGSIFGGQRWYILSRLVPSLYFVLQMGETALDKAIDQNHTDVVQLLLQQYT